MLDTNLHELAQVWVRGAKVGYTEYWYPEHPEHRLTTEQSRQHERTIRSIERSYRLDVAWLIFAVTVTSIAVVLDVIGVISALVREDYWRAAGVAFAVLVLSFFLWGYRVNLKQSRQRREQRYRALVQAVAYDFLVNEVSE